MSFDEIVAASIAYAKAKDGEERAANAVSIHEMKAAEARARIIASARHGELDDGQVRALLQAKRQAQVNQDKANVRSRDRNNAQRRLEKLLEGK